MSEKNYFNSLSPEDKLLYSRITDMIDQSQSKYMQRFSFFLDERQCSLSQDILNSLKIDNFRLYGGYSSSKRNVLCIFPDFLECSDEDFPITPIEFKYRKSDLLMHKDFLGALMSQQIKREVLGDIIVGEGSSIVFIYNTAVDMILNDVNKIGRVGVNLSIYKDKDIKREDSFEDIVGTVSSLRLDSMVSLSIRQSREKSALIIKSIGVDVNYKKTYSQDFILKEGDIFSVKGHGKFVLYNIGGLTKKERHFVTVRKYI